MKRTQFQKINGWCLWCSSSANAFALPRFPENMQSSEWVPGCSACLLIYPATRIEQGWFYPGKSWKNEKTGWNLLYFRSGFWYQKFKEFVKQKCSLTAKVLTRFTLGLYGEAKVCPPPGSADGIGSRIPYVITILLSANERGKLQDGFPEVPKGATPWRELKARKLLENLFKLSSKFLRTSKACGSSKMRKVLTRVTTPLKQRVFLHECIHDYIHTI